MGEWKEYRLGDVLELIGGGTPKTNNPAYWNGDIPWLSVVDFNNGMKYVAETEKYITHEGLRNSSTKILNKGDIIISARGTVGVIAILKKSMAFNQSCYGVRAKYDLTFNDYLYYLLKISSVFLFDTERKITDEGLGQIGSGLPPMGTVLLSSRAPIGYLAITDVPIAINQGCIGIICDKNISNYFIYLWYKENMSEIENAGNGSVFQEISKSSFKALDIAIPPIDILECFDKKIEPLFKKMNTNQTQIHTFTSLRNILLPKF
ncbi:MAG: restriction endonuclease subunit S [Bacteroidales bacterium]|jgi:restriction endonuclease S subunit|nr:restriction endonuclease subunit S [Bacteroidales bacterium]